MNCKNFLGLMFSLLLCVGSMPLVAADTKPSTPTKTDSDFAQAAGNAVTTLVEAISRQADKIAKATRDAATTISSGKAVEEQGNSLTLKIIGGGVGIGSIFYVGAGIKDLFYNWSDAFPNHTIRKGLEKAHIMRATDPKDPKTDAYNKATHGALKIAIGLAGILLSNHMIFNSAKITTKMGWNK